MEASAPNASHAEEGSSGSSGARLPLDRAEAYHSPTPEVASRTREGASTSSSSRSRDRSSRSWDERDRRDHGPRGSGALFSPPSYKVRLGFCDFADALEVVTVMSLMFWRVSSLALLDLLQVLIQALLE
jgi:hypothetical protein